MTATAVRDEQRNVEAAFRGAQEIMAVAESIRDPAERTTVRTKLRTRILRMIKNLVPPVRLSVVSRMFGYDDKTIRRWVAMGILREVQTKPRIAVDPVRLFEVSVLIDDIRQFHGQRDFTNALWSALQDQATLDDPDLIQALDQMASGDRRRWTRRPDGSWGPDETARA